MSDYATVQVLVSATRCFACINPPTQLQVQTYILAYAYGDLGLNPSTLIQAAKCMRCLGPNQLREVRAYLLARAAGGSTDPQVLAREVACYECVPNGYFEAINTYLMSQEPGGPGIADPNELVAAANSFQGLEPEQALEIQVYILGLSTGAGTDPNVLANLARCYSCLPLKVREGVTTNLIRELEDDGGIVGCTDVPSTLIPVITGTYVAGVLTSLNILLPKVCCDPDHIAIFEADAADGTGETPYANSAVNDSYGGTSNYSVDIPIVIPFTKEVVYARQVCGDATESANSNFLHTSGGECGIASNSVTVIGAGEADANGTFVFDLTTWNNAGIIVYINPVNNWYIHFSDGDPVPGLVAVLYDTFTVAKYDLPVGQCFPCGIWQQSGGAPGALPVPTAMWT